jgi:hypothetical protein
MTDFISRELVSFFQSPIQNSSYSDLNIEFCKSESGCNYAAIRAVSLETLGLEVSRVSTYFPVSSLDTFSPSIETFDTDKKK